MLEQYLKNNKNSEEKNLIQDILIKKCLNELEKEKITNKK